MMKTSEPIKTLRWCGSEDERHEMCVDESYRCPLWNEDRMTDYCKADLMLAAADALEAQEPTEKQVVDYCHKRCLVIVEEELFQRMKATCSLMPKEGEWIGVNPMVDTE